MHAWPSLEKLLYSISISRFARNNPIHSFDKRDKRNTHNLYVTRSRQPQPHFQKKREAEAEAAENLSSSEESSDLSEAETQAEGENMDAEGRSNVYDGTIFFLI